MKLVDDFLVKVGADKVLHHTVGAMICAFITFVSIIQDGIIDWYLIGYPTIGASVVFIISVIKEYAFDDKVDWKDIIWAMGGCLWIYIAIIIGLLFNTNI